MGLWVGCGLADWLRGAGLYQLQLDSDFLQVSCHLGTNQSVLIHSVGGRGTEHRQSQCICSFCLRHVPTFPHQASHMAKPNTVSREVARHKEGTDNSPKDGER